MYIKIQTSPLSSGNTGSCKSLVQYLEKENEKKLYDKEFFFSQSKECVLSHEVIELIDSNKQGLRKDEAKFYSVVIAPSEKELEYIGNSQEALKTYTRSVMEAYAENFNKGLKSEDLVWFAKIEHERAYKGLEEIPSDKKQGDLKEGLQTHIHVVVSRKTADKKIKISPLANQRGTEITTGKGQKVTAGFDREKFKQSCEHVFDEKFSYDRPENEKLAYYKASEIEKVQMLEQREKTDYNKKEMSFEEIIEYQRNQEKRKEQTLKNQIEL
jgi:hypothetical protein